ncbi:MAG: glycosyltransferase family 4 protein [Planctomycetaceae bacterium]
MRVLVNGLSIGALSGRHVVYGFLRPLTRWTRGEHEFVLLTHESEPPPEDLPGANVRHISLSDRLRPWWWRTAWEYRELPKLVRREKIDLVLTASGAVTPTCGAPQVSLAQNPWCLVPAAQYGARQRWKAALQRRAYRQALQSAAMMVFISRYLESLYGQLKPEGRVARSEIAYVGLDEGTHTAAEAMRARVEKQRLLIVSVSAMAPWKGAETLVTALHKLRRDGVAARLRLVGPWPDSVYRSRIERLIDDLKLRPDVEITGQVTKEDLHRHYAEAQVFCLMSCCESFGIPAAEAQAFATPVVSTRDCAVSEICAGGGRFGPADNPDWTAGALAELLTNATAWRECSERGVANARALRWDECARPLMNMFSVVG